MNAWLHVQVGVIWRFVQRDSKGNIFIFNVEFKEIESSSRLVYTFEIEAMPGHIILETITFDEKHGKTTVTATGLFQKIDDSHGMINSGMKEGALESCLLVFGASKNPLRNIPWWVRILWVNLKIFWNHTMHQRELYDLPWINHFQPTLLIKLSKHEWKRTM